jgi:hypothetical protein
VPLKVHLPTAYLPHTYCIPVLLHVCECAEQVRLLLESDFVSVLLSQHVKSALMQLSLQSQLGLVLAALIGQADEGVDEVLRRAHLCAREHESSVLCCVVKAVQ